VNIITHLLASWTASEFSGVDEKRDRMLVAWAGVSPDLDGLGVLVDLSARAFGLEDPMLYGRFHHASEPPAREDVRVGLRDRAPPSAL
jgi:hypothetical protein